MYISDAVDPSPQLQIRNQKPKVMKRKSVQAKQPVRKKQKRLGKIRDDKPKGDSPLLKFGFRRKA